ncbi:hypothetical protein EAF04_008864 [Stromatinia cepivora]|nr:hypothetical protein EAF04_008864 [Stromatinia cepivora]
MVLSPNRISITPGLTSTRSSKEHRYFDHFRHRTIFGLMGVNADSEFWRRMILQLSEAYPAVLHAVIAISVLHDYLVNPSYATQRVFLLQYNKSIRYIRSLESEDDIQVTLTCCIIFVCLENAQGNHGKALEHLENGLRIYNTWAAQDTPPAIKQAQENILEVFTRFDVQATSFWDSRKPVLIPDSNIQEPECGDRFPSLQAASLAQQYYELRIFYVLTAVSPKPSRSHSHRQQQQQRQNPSNSEPPFPHRTKLLHAFNTGMLNWKRAFDGLIRSSFSTWNPREIHRSLLLQLHYQTLSLIVDLRVHSHLTTNSEHIPISEHQRFQSIIDISRSVLRHASSEYGGAFLTADGGVIAPLYFIAMSAPDPHLYRQAIELLRLVRKKEGFWQAEEVLRVAERVAGRREGMGEDLDGKVLGVEGAGLAGVEFRTELFVEDEGEAGVPYDL